jgi:hypothetical protein
MSDLPPLTARSSARSTTPCVVSAPALTVASAKRLCLRALVRLRARHHPSPRWSRASTVVPGLRDATVARACLAALRGRRARDPTSLLVSGLALALAGATEDHARAEVGTAVRLALRELLPAALRRARGEE